MYVPKILPLFVSYSITSYFCTLSPFLLVLAACSYSFCFFLLSLVPCFRILLSGSSSHGVRFTVCIYILIIIIALLCFLYFYICSVFRLPNLRFVCATWQIILYFHFIVTFGNFFALYTIYVDVRQLQCNRSILNGSSSYICTV